MEGDLRDGGHRDRLERPPTTALGWAFLAAAIVVPMLVIGGLSRLLFDQPWGRLDRHENQALMWMIVILAGLTYGAYRLVTWLT